MSQKITPAELAELRRQILTGDSARDIAARTGRSIPTISQIRKRMREEGLIMCFDRWSAGRYDAFIRVEAAQDVADAILLLLNGVNVSINPVSGCLTGPPKPLDLTIIHRVRDDEASPEIERGPPVIRVEETPYSMIAAVTRLLTDKRTASDLVVDCSGVPAARATAVTEAIVGIARTLNHRALRLLTATDIADVVAWIAPLSSARLDVQVPYGSPEWGPIARGDVSVRGLTSHRPAPAANVTSTVVCYAKPTVDDLRRILEAAEGRTVGIVNGKLARARVPMFAGASPNKALLLGNRVLAPTITVDVTEFSEEGALWGALKSAGQVAVDETMTPIDPALAPAWAHMRAAHHQIGVDIIGYEAIVNERDLRTLRHHALDGAMERAKHHGTPIPFAAATTRLDVDDDVDPVEALTALPRLLPVTDHGIAVTVPVTKDTIPRVVTWLDHYWDHFVGADFAG